MARVCPHCEATTTFTPRWQDSTASRDGDIDPDRPLWFCDTCDNCEQPVLGVYTAGSTLEEGPFHVWPDVVPPRKTYADVPPAIASAALEARQALHAQAPHASIAMARATVEATANDKGITQGRLVSKIDRLAADGHISVAMKEAAHEIRLAGNDAVHDILNEPISLEEAAQAVELMDAILERVYQDPEKVARFRASREARRNREERVQSGQA